MYWLFYLSLIGMVGSIIFYSYLYGITPTPTSRKVKEQLLKLLPEFENQEIVELGSGWGTLAFALARRYPTCQVKGFEISPIPYFFSKIISKWVGLPNLTFERKDFFHVSLKNVSLIVCYLYPEAMKKLKYKFEEELFRERQVYVVSHTFAIPGWIPLYVNRAFDLYRTPIYIYKIFN